MEELIGSNVQIILSIKDGRGFEKNILHPTLLTATLNGHTLVTDMFGSHTNLYCATNLVWETDKSSIRKMRSNHTPIKVEYFVFNRNNIKEKVGYLLLNIRCAQIIPRSKELPVKEDWYKLLGLQGDFKGLNLEFLLSLTVEDRHIPISHSLSEAATYTPCLLRDECLIQLGPLNDCHDLFLFNAMASCAANLDLLLPNESNKDIKDIFTFHLKILDNDITLKPFEQDTTDSWMLNEKIVIRIRTSLKALRCYLQAYPYLFVSLLYGLEPIGEGKVDVTPLVSTNSIEKLSEPSSQSSIMITQRCFLVNNRAHVVQEIGQRKPYLDIQVKLQYTGNERKSTTLGTDALLQTGKQAISSVIQSDKQKSKEISAGRALTEIESHRNPSGDSKMSFGNFNHTTLPANEWRNVNTHHSNFSTCMKLPSDLNLEATANSNACYFDDDFSKDVKVYHCYCLCISLNAIRLTLDESTHDIEFRFHHPKAESISTHRPKTPIPFGKKVQLQDIECKLHFVSSMNDIQGLLISYPPKMSVCAASDHDKTCISESVLSTKSLFDQNAGQCQYTLSLENADKCKFGDIDVTLKLEDLGPYHKLQKELSGDYLGLPILDDDLAYKIVDELETWRERQKEIFKAELKRKEERHLSLLSEEWRTRREDLESRLAYSVSQCKMLANSLSNATEDLKTRRIKSLEKEARLIKANEDLQTRYELKVHELTDSTRAMQEDFMMKIKILEEKKATAEAQIESLAIENEKLRSIISKQSEELAICKKSSLTQDQTRSLLHELKALEEKLSNVQRSKSFFKEQWGKAVREIHKMKMENQQAVEMHIKNSKEELRNLNLEEILCADSAALSNDQVLLSQLQKEIDVIKPRSPSTQSNHQHDIFTPINNVLPNRTPNGGTRLDEQDERLRQLIEERDSLLKTRSYSIDDAVIVQLNTEIRSLLLNG